MNDTELDELLDTWKTPAPRRALRESVQIGIEAARRLPPRKRFTPWRLAAAAAVVVAAFLLVDSDAFSSKAGPPYMVDSEIIHYRGSFPGGPPWNYYSMPESPLVTSFNNAGSEVILSWSSPDHPFEAALWRTRLAVSGEYDRLGARFLSILESFNPGHVTEPNGYEDSFARVYPERVGYSVTVGRRDSLLSSGCRPMFGAWQVVGQDTILNYPTVVVQEGLRGGRTTLWMASQLSCFALRATIEKEQPDGTWELLSEKKALKVTVTH